MCPEECVGLYAPEAPCTACALGLASHFYISTFVSVGAAGVALFCANQVLHICHDKVVCNCYVGFHAILASNQS